MVRGMYELFAIKQEVAHAKLHSYTWSNLRQTSRLVGIPV